MQEPLLGALRGRRPSIRVRWEELLRTERVMTPLANPDALVHLIDWTLDEIFAALASPVACEQTRGTRLPPEEKPSCPCGRNPLLVYFAGGEQAVREALILAQASLSPLDPRQRDASFEELNLVFQEISRREIEAFCGVCQLRHSADCEPVSTSANGPLATSGKAGPQTN